ncbi:hypothetical protein [Rufibacter soli]
MEEEDLYTGNLQLTSLEFYEGSKAWNFKFEDKVILQVDCLWRILSEGKIRFTSKDHGLNFGHEIALDLTSEILNLIRASKLQQINRRTLTGDLNLNFQNDFKVEIINDSSGFENWLLILGATQHVGITPF